MSLSVLLEHPWARVLTVTLLHFIWQGAFIAVGLATLVDLVGVRRPNWRYGLSLTALILMATCPAGTLVWLSQSAISSASSAPNDALLSSASVPVSGGRWGELISWSQRYILAGWSIGVLFFSCRLLVGFFGVRQLRRSCVALPQELVARVERLSARLGMRAQSVVYLSCHVSQAMAVGFVRPIVLIPAAWAVEMPVVVLEAVVAHELAHLRRWDIAVNVLQRFVEALLFYHPAVWWLSRRIRFEREFCCDELAVTVTGQRVEYVQALETVARTVAHVEPLFAANIRGESDMQILLRVRNVLGVASANDRSRIWPAGLLAMMLPLGAWVCTAGFVTANTPVAVAEDDDERDDDDDDNDDERRERRDSSKRNQDADDDDDKPKATSRGEPDQDERKFKRYRVKDVPPRDGYSPKPMKRNSGDDDDVRPAKAESKAESEDEPGYRVTKIRQRKPDPEKASADDEVRAIDLQAMVETLVAENKKLRAELEKLRAATKREKGMSEYESLYRESLRKAAGDKDAQDDSADDGKQALYFRLRKTNQEDAVKQRELAEQRLKEAHEQKDKAATLELKLYEAIKQKDLEGRSRKEKQAILEKEEAAARDQKLKEAAEQKELEVRALKQKKAILEKEEAAARDQKLKEAIEKKYLELRTLEKQQDIFEKDEAAARAQVKNKAGELSSKLLIQKLKPTATDEGKAAADTQDKDIAVELVSKLLTQKLKPTATDEGKPAADTQDKDNAEESGVKLLTRKRKPASADEAAVDTQKLKEAEASLNSQLRAVKEKLEILAKERAEKEKESEQDEKR